MPGDHVFIITIYMSWLMKAIDIGKITRFHPNFSMSRGCAAERNVNTLGLRSA
jgi:hypothetical protein